MEINKLFAFNGRYLVTPWGDIYSVNYRNTGRRKKIKQWKGNHGYMLCCIDGKDTLAHRFIAETLIPNPDNKPEIDHINGIRDDNRVENLRWVTSSENNLNPITRKRMSESLTNGSNSKKVYQYSLSGEFIQEWPSTKEVQRQLGCNSSQIIGCALHRAKSAYGFQWSYEKKNHIGPKKRKQGLLNNPKTSKKVYQYSTDGLLVREWLSSMEVQRELGFKQPLISACCRGKLKQAYGFIWSYSPLS